MRTRTRITGLISFGLLWATATLNAQVTVESNTIVGAGPFVGCDVNSTVPLQVRHDANFPIDWYTNAIRRLTLLPDATYTIGSFTNQQKDGNLLLCPKVDNFYGNGGPGPYSLLHLADRSNNAQSASYREWMRTGITFTGNLDHGYVGQKGAEEDETDMVMHWSDNPGDEYKDHLRFIFTSGFSGSATSGATSAEGLEGMRLYPKSYDEINVGIGDFYAGNLADPSNVVEPTERLDILTGNLRIRDLPSTGEAPLLDKFIVVDNNGVVRWRYLASPPTGGCDWDGAAGVLATAYRNTPLATGCPDKTWRLGIGTASPNFKMEIAQSNADDTFSQGGLAVTYSGPATGISYGTVSTVQGQGGGTLSSATALYGKAYDIDDYGVAVRGDVISEPSDGTATLVQSVMAKASADAGDTYQLMAVNADAQVNSPATADQVYGVRSITSGSGIDTNYGLYSWASSGTNRYGIWAEADAITNSWAGHFQGNLRITGNGFVNGTVAISSDAQFKTNIEDLTGSLDVVTALRPHTYHFVENAPLGMYFPEGRQPGLIAQEVEEVLPQLVLGTTHPEQLNAEGVVISEALPYKAVNYIGLIPYLIGAIQEQQAELSSLREQVVSCCANQANMQASPVSPEDERIDDNGLSSSAQLHIQPNPFNERTTVYYRVENTGRAQLMANSADGKELRVLHEASLEKGEYQYDWNTADLAPGMYYVTLLLDGSPVTKKAVKVSR